MAEKEKKKQIPLRISEALWQELMIWSDDEFRSINGQIEYLLTEAVKKRRGGNASKDIASQNMAGKKEGGMEI